MSKISGKETRPEILVRKFLHANGFRFRKNVKDLPGKPDIVLPRYNSVIFVHGCFWHGHNCKAGELPATNQDFWQKKILANIARDNQNINKLESMGWQVIVIWQCQIKNNTLVNRNLSQLITRIKDSS